MSAKTLYAWTAADTPYPPYINFTEIENGDVQITLRSRSTDFITAPTASVILSKAVMREMLAKLSNSDQLV